MSEEHQPEPIHDPPIEHDDLGQALLTLPLAVAEGAKDVAVWAASETIIPAAEHIIDYFKGGEEPTAATIDLPETEETSTHATYVSHEDAP